jgi:ABC-type cobalamin/Fe3+-siderophores transport system ATPase subunit
MTGARTRDLSHTFQRGAHALDSVTVDAPAGALTTLLGPNGSGKSTLLRVLAGVIRPTAGQVEVGEADPGLLPRATLARRVAYLPAQPSVPSEYTALEVVLMGRHPFGRGLLLERPADLERGQRALERSGALAFRDRPCRDLSSGERQRVLLARVLCQDVPTLLLDEPTSAQDPAHALELFALFATLAREGRCVVVASHDLNAAARHADRLVVLRGGRLVCDGAPAEVLTAETLSDVFAIDALVGTDGGVPYAVPRAPRGAGR